MIRTLVALLAVIAGVALATPAFAHASLLRTDPGEGTIVSAAPKQIVLTFNEPVTPVRIRIVGTVGAGRDLRDAHVNGNEVVVSVPADVGTGTQTLSWRVVSADSHPVAGTFSFSIGQPTASGTTTADQSSNPAVSFTLWAEGLLFLGGLLFGVGGAFFVGWMAPGADSRPVARFTLFALMVGIAAGILSLGAQGLDVLGEPLSAIASIEPWQTALLSTYGATWMVAEIGFLLALVGLLSKSRQLAAVLSAAALVSVGFALSLSGHASDAPPRNLTWAAVLLHGAGAAFWAGALVPLGLLFASRNRNAGKALRRFSAAIPFAIVPLVAAGALLAFVQLTKIEDLWTTPYGLILSTKLIAVAGLFVLAVINRYRLTRPALAGEAKASRSLVLSVRVEWALVLLILALVAGWRLTSPPRALFAATSATASATALPLYVMPAAADGLTMANVNFLPGRPGPNDVVVQVTNQSMVPIDVKEVTVTLSNPAAGIEPITRTATKDSEGHWRVSGLTLPVPGTWKLTVGALVSDFEKKELGADVLINP